MYPVGSYCANMSRYTVHKIVIILHFCSGILFGTNRIYINERFFHVKAGGVYNTNSASNM